MTTLVVSLLGTSHGFVPQRKQLPPVRSCSSWNNKLHGMDPSHSVVWETAATAAASSFLLISEQQDGVGDATVSYSKASYYTVLALYIMSFPGLWSQIKRSTTAKVKRKTYVSPGENSTGGKDLRQQAGEIMACKFLVCIQCVCRM